eukprot:TRINITY_DN13795_c0_g1_i1.p1 TRINITY_DN13795_c0_g1~~TRINITY_DN13795_c0_g1_i1.p1  ORF type:complete len:260 (-),score=47.98 TRINITY_DN13795_c0_g1_i1:896-1675(-)
MLLSFSSTAVGMEENEKHVDLETRKEHQRRVKRKQVLEDYSEIPLERPPLGRPSLPRRILKMRENSFSLFVSNISEDMSKTEMDAMFCRGGKILDSFIPIDMNNGKKGGLLSSDSVPSKKQKRQWSWREADHGEEGKYRFSFLNINKSLNQLKRMITFLGRMLGLANPCSAGQVNPWLARQRNPWSARQAWNAGLKGLMKEDTPSKKVGWVVSYGDLLGVRIASNVIKEGKENLIFSLVGKRRGRRNISDHLLVFWDLG